MSDDDDADEDWKSFNQHRESLNKQGADQLANFDKTVMFLATGALGLSLVFIEKIAGRPVVAMELLGIAWSGFSITITFSLLSFVTSWMDTVLEIKFMDDNVNGNWRKKHRNLPKLATISLNLLSVSAFTVGVIYMLLFASQNMVGASMTKHPFTGLR